MKTRRSKTDYFLSNVDKENVCPIPYTVKKELLESRPTHEPIKLILKKSSESTYKVLIPQTHPIQSKVIYKFKPTG